MFLLATAVLKMFSATTESRVLAVPDPLLLYVTKRQTLFLAATAELIVARLLWVERFDGVRPAVTVWLALLFGIYRGGLLALGYREDCGCLGHAVVWFPALDKWVDPMMWSVIVCMLVTGGVFLRVRRRTHGGGVTAPG